MARLSIVLIVICIGGFVTSFFQSNPKKSSASTKTSGLDAVFQQQINALGKRQQRKNSIHKRALLKGNEVSLINLIAKPEKYKKKPFVIFGQITPENPTQNKAAPCDFRFQELTAKHQKIPQAIANLQLANKQAGALLRQIQKNNQTLTHGRFRVTFQSSQTKTSPLQLKILDWQFAQDDHSGFGPWNTPPSPSS